MATDLLTDKAIRSAIKAAVDTGKPGKHADGRGLHLEARPTGVGWWRFRYRFGGREAMLSLGVYPDVPLALARARRDEARRMVAAGVDPAQARKAEKAEQRRQVELLRYAEAGIPGPGTFEHTAREWLTTKHEHEVSPGHAARTLRRFEVDVFPALGWRPIAEIEPPELLAVLRKIEARGAIETAHRAKDSCSQVFRFAIAAGLCTRNPAADLRDALRPVPTRHHAAIVKPDEVAALLRAVADYKGNPITRAALDLSALLLLRPGELRHLEWRWIDGDTIVIPPHLMKRRKHEKANGEPHLVPLARQAVAIFEGLRPITGGGRFVFPALTGRDRCMSENTVRAALRRMGYANDEMTAHGFRAMARTLIAERLGVPAEVIEAQLAHAVPDALGRAYNRTTFIEQRREMMQRWADYLDRLRDGGEVIEMPQRGVA
ncbi:integrase arm-type DNA-binding domain-containing protein [Calidifontimicrobium sp. SYSU G02091]|uniref:tyrosine-type recombinase/integrase n=1 Tax=Calidifontimicrobium sp. SYSU G02091 TaxID=2926421 RepID=UPI001F52C282|nr:integrase arm-type DNA-binding domain-containing protein [Calidifontimicrobium sp. SYSU G02091]MCI1191600.1 integrase arm-type DNA-binding domain-containing protein [Calidifontimicrobium sp. SYSU G02091]